MNPFLSEAIPHIRKKIRKIHTDSKHATTVAETGEIIEKVISTTKEYVKEDYVSIFIYSIKDKFKFDLSPAGTKMWMILMLAYVDTDQDKIYYHYEDKICNQSLSRATYYKAIKELSSHGVITPHERLPFTFYVNPAYFFNGKRIKLINNVYLKSDENK